MVWPSGATKTISAPAPPAAGLSSRSRSRASWDSEPGMLNRSSNEPPAPTRNAITAPSTTNQISETRPRCRNETRPSRARNELMEGTPDSVGDDRTQQQQERRPLEVVGRRVDRVGLRAFGAGRFGHGDLLHGRLLKCEAVVRGQGDAGELPGRDGEAQA